MTINFKVIGSNELSEWYAALEHLDKLEPCFLPEYHSAYTRDSLQSSMMLHLNDGKHHFCYPFILTQIGDNRILGAQFSDYADVSSVYGYSGPYANTNDPDFINEAWILIDEWLTNRNVIAEFTRYSPFLKNTNFRAHGTKLEINRKLAFSMLTNKPDVFSLLDSKTRNMIRKAEKNGLIFSELEERGSIKAFRELYNTTMERNKPEKFFMYDEAYFSKMSKLNQKGYLKIYGVRENNQIIAAAMVLTVRSAAIYHLGCSNEAGLKSGASNLLLFKIHQELIKNGVTSFNLGGGRAAVDEDPLLRFKCKNSIGTSDYFIGKRVINSRIYKQIKDIYLLYDPSIQSENRIIYYR